MVLSRDQQILMPEVHTAEVSPQPCTADATCAGPSTFPFSEDGYEKAADRCQKMLSSFFLGLLGVKHLFICTLDLGGLKA